MTKKTPFLLSLCFAAGVGLLACGGAGSSDNTSNAAGGNTNKAASGSTTASGDKIGVPECDDYIAKYEACVDSKVPETMRATVKASMETARKQWKDLAATPQGKAGLAQACKAATDTAKQAMSSYGCSW
ncbi:MAG TPA: hypothetical protein VLJ61_05975 [Pyrinomonadaceae bacterium]|nr:hypothetical protein [Pyrinomonadaceae bacterium]